MTKLRNDALLVQPCPVHGRKPELFNESAFNARYPRLILRCPVPGCVCESDPAPSHELAIEEWDAMTYSLTGRDGTPDFPLLALESGDDDQLDPFDPENDND